uniref:RRM domain-containing protein n=1 Tax=Leersia perrieri TaxID=77586 RepID=A0A0D9X7G7_9ORYZ
MSQSNEVRYTARSITPPADRNGTVKSKSPTPVRRSTSRSPPPKKGDSRSPPPRRRSTSRSPRPRGRGRSRSRDDDLRNPGNNLYVTGLSTRVTEEDLEKFFSKEGKVQSCHVVLDPRTKESRGFAFVTMDTVEDARRCIKYLHRTVLEGRLVTVQKSLKNFGEICLGLGIIVRMEKDLFSACSNGVLTPHADFLNFQFIWVNCLNVNLAKRTRERTPTPGKYCGRRGSQRQSRSPSPHRSRRERSRSRDRRKDRSRSRDRRRDRSRSRDRRRDRSRSRDRRRDRSRSRDRRRDRSRSRDRRGSSPRDRDSHRRHGDRSKSPATNGNHKKD